MPAGIRQATGLGVWDQDNLPGNSKEMVIGPVSSFWSVCRNRLSWRAPSSHQLWLMLADIHPSQGHHPHGHHASQTLYFFQGGEPEVTDHESNGLKWCWYPSAREMFSHLTSLVVSVPPVTSIPSTAGMIQKGVKYICGGGGRAPYTSSSSSSHVCKQHGLLSWLAVVFG